MNQQNKIFLKIGIAATVSSLMVGCQSPANPDESLSFSNSNRVQTNSSGLGKLKLVSTTDSSSALLLTKSKRTQQNSNSDLAEANIEITSIQIKGSNGTYSVQISPFMLDLTQLDTQFDAALVRAKLPAGNYDSIRLITTERGYAKYSDGTVCDLDVPSGPQSGIKVFFDKPIVISDNKLTIATFHFDVTKSFVKEAKSIHFKPVIRPSVSDPISLPNSNDGSGGSSNPNSSSSTDGSNSSSQTDSGSHSSDGSSGSAGSTGSTSDGSSVTPTDNDDISFIPVLGV